MSAPYSLLDQLNGILKAFSEKTRCVKAAVVADANGHPLASDCPEGIDPRMIAAIGTLLAQSAESAFEKLRYAMPEVIMIEGPDAHIATVGLPRGIVNLTVLLEKNANMGLVKIEIKRAAVQVGLAVGVGLPMAPTISELFILYHDGTLIRHYSDTLRTEADRDLLRGMLSAVQSFIEEAFASGEGSLREMRFGEHTIGFVRGNHTAAAFILDQGDREAAQYVVFDALKDFEEKYGPVLQDWKGSVHDFPGIDESFRKIFRPAAGSA